LERHGEATAGNLLNLRQASDTAWIHALKTERPSIQTATQNESCRAMARAALLLEAAPLYASTLKWRSQPKEKDHL
jgi:hypothetical protein